jgi:hypothetical protein
MRGAETASADASPDYGVHTVRLRAGTLGLGAAPTGSAPQQRRRFRDRSNLPCRGFNFCGRTYHLEQDLVL